MPTILTHAAPPIAIGIALGSSVIPRKLLVAGIVASILPDLDVLAFRLGINYANEFGHRGFSHSLTFALLVSIFALIFSKSLNAPKINTWIFILISALSHPLLDMLTTGGMGVALWWPYSEQRLFFPIQVIKVSPLSLRRVFGEPGLRVLGSEILWVWLPLLTASVSIFLMKKRALVSNVKCNDSQEA